MKTGTKIDHMIVSSPASEMSYEEVLFDGTKEEFITEMENTDTQFITVYGDIYEGNKRMELHIRKSEIQGYGIEAIDLDAKDVIAPASYFLPEEEDEEPDSDIHFLSDDDEPLRTVEDDEPDTSDQNEDNYKEYIAEQLKIAFGCEKVLDTAIERILAANQEISSRIRAYYDSKDTTCEEAYGDCPEYVAIDLIVDCIFMYALLTKESLPATMRHFTLEKLIKISWEAFLQAEDLD